MVGPNGERGDIERPFHTKNLGELLLQVCLVVVPLVSNCESISVLSQGQWVRVLTVLAKRKSKLLSRRKTDHGDGGDWCEGWFRSVLVSGGLVSNVEMRSAVKSRKLLTFYTPSQQQNGHGWAHLSRCPTSRHPSREGNKCDRRPGVHFQGANLWQQMSQHGPQRLLLLSTSTLLQKMFRAQRSSPL